MSGQKTSEAQDGPDKGERIAKVMARAGLCSRREAESWIAAGRVSINGRVLTTPAITVTERDKIVVDGQPLQARERSRLFLYHKPKGLVCTQRDPEGRPTVFAALPPDLPRVMSIGRLDINTEGLLLLTNDGGLARVLELPSTGWLRRYRVRAHGRIDQETLDRLKRGIAVGGMLYGPIDAVLERQQGDNVWLLLGLREGKNREVKRVLEHLGLVVNRLIRVSYGPFQLGDLPVGTVKEVPGRTLRDQLGERLAETSGADFTAPPRPTSPSSDKPQPAAKGGAKPGRKGGGGNIGRGTRLSPDTDQASRKGTAKTGRGTKETETRSPRSGAKTSNPARQATSGERAVTGRSDKKSRDRKSDDKRAGEHTSGKGRPNNAKPGNARPGNVRPGHTGSGDAKTDDRKGGHAHRRRKP
ncbi:23S rRNA pseudouridine2605 synthase [Rhodopseudomonas julia]|uniref:Pseudouridine synthase n=1 Tax=Rhodopseudomonas julia TaxID=200617 RepID=A0ABU0C2U5_9BRAD|nr:23S rRNA pseudouridine2605 synthase [Rhodopseudomonas julia]